MKAHERFKLRKGDSKIAFNYLDAYKLHELGNLFNCRAGESISPVITRAQANLTISSFL